MPRTGTSLVMQTIALLGHQVYGVQFPTGRIKNNNPKGFWEDSNALNGHIREITGSVAVKVMLRALIEGVKDNRIKLNSTDHKIIVCTRNHDAAALSQELAGAASGQIRNKRNMKIWYDKFTNDNLTLFPNIPQLTIDYADIVANPTLYVDKIKSFTNAFGTTKRAIDNIGVIV